MENPPSNESGVSIGTWSGNIITRVILPTIINHIVWITKYRKKILIDDIAPRLRDVVRQICSEEKIDILKGAIGPDHVHILLAIPPYIAVSRIVQHLKGESSQKLQMEFPRLGKVFWGQHMWRIGYFCVTTGTVTEETIKRYIAEQGKKGGR